MTRLLVIGNSHTGALKEGWPAVAPDFPGVKLSFFVAPQPSFRACRREGTGFGLPADCDPHARRIVEKLNGTDRIDLAGFDAVAWGGFPWSLPRVADILVTYDIDGLRDSDAPRRMSQAAFRAACDDIARDSLPPEPWRNTLPPLFVITRPVPSEALLDEGHKPTKWRRALRGGRSIAPALAVFAEAVGRALGEIGIGYVPPPRDTIGPLGLTPARFARGSSRLASGHAHDEDDIGHMNGDYGALVLRDLMTRIGVPAPVA